MDRVVRGWNTLIVIPDDPSLGIVETVFEVKDGDPGPKRVELSRLTPMKVHVRDKHGNPVPSAQVQVIDPRDSVIRLDTNVIVMDHRDSRRTLWATCSAMSVTVGPISPILRHASMRRILPSRTTRIRVTS